MSQREASVALRRFGLGPRPGDMVRVAADPRGYVLAALKRKDAAVIADPELEPSHVNLTALRGAQKQQQEARNLLKAAQQKMQEGEVAPQGGTPTGQPMQIQVGAKPGEIRREVFREEARARLAHAVATDAPFVERLVMFWSNHFSVSAMKGPAVRVIAGAFEREAIRPHVLGRFADMLRAVEQHPAMLIYLDNAQSIGPNSPAGINRGRGLNENLAREILELHTLGVGGGYSQGDVTSFARVLTGWSVATPPLGPGANVPVMSDVAPGQFIFTPNRHEPGPQTIMGKRYEERGRASGEAVLGDLARHRSTARHLATKLARHFVADDPPAQLVERLQSEYLRTDGDLAAVSTALATAEACWAAPARKVVPPYDFHVAAMRGLGIDMRPAELIRLSAAIGQPLWAPPSPKGWPDDDDAWMGPSAVRERLRIAERVARMVDRKADPRVVAADLFGDALGRETKLAIERAEVREQGFELIVMCPQFLRR